ncbi:MAG: hypothetical protein HZA78_04640 [Candidatus Schekmanbacteria bacterium]|nr:hypothetical protein [Candidatus Schekmanbacteria bacterium]
MIAVFFALSQEIASLKSRVNILKKIRYAHATLYQSEFCGFPIMLVQGGVGQNMAETVRNLSNSFRIQVMVSAGFAGSINPGVGVGDLIIGRRILHTTQEEFNGEIEIDSTHACDDVLVAMASRLSSAGGFKAHCGDVLCVNKVVSQATAKRQLGNCTSAICVDMESSIIAARAHELGIPFVAIRAISDGMDEDMEVSESVITKGGNINIPVAAYHLLSKPHQIPDMNRLRSQIKRAKRTLSKFFPDFITQTYNSLLA